VRKPKCQHKSSLTLKQTVFNRLSSTVGLSRGVHLVQHQRAFSGKWLTRDALWWLTTALGTTITFSAVCGVLTSDQIVFWIHWFSVGLLGLIVADTRNHILSKHGESA